MQYTVTMETIGEARNLNTKGKMAESRFALSNKIVVDQLKLNAKNKKNNKINTNVVECLGKMGKQKKIQC